MAADLHIHIFSGITEEDLRLIKCNVLGSKYFDIRMNPDWEDVKKVWEKVDKEPHIWIGEVSWLKADLMDDENSFVPQTVQSISELVGEDLPVIDDEFIFKVEEAFKLPNNTIKEGGVWGGEGYALADVNDVISFLREHRGCKVYQVSW